MELKVLCVGDVVGGPGMERIRRSLRYLRRQTGADFVIVNGENAAVVGMTPQQGEEILDAGADCITMGNHTWGKREIVPYMEDCPRILRPANYAPQVPGRGWREFETKAGVVAVIDLIGRCNMDYGPENPFLLVEDAETDKGQDYSGGDPRGGHLREAGHGLDAGRTGQCRVGDPYPCAHRGCADPPKGYGLCDRSWHDGTEKLHSRHSSGAFHSKIPG